MHLNQKYIEPVINHLHQQLMALNINMPRTKHENVQKLL
jgi:hypothetical protein